MSTTSMPSRRTILTAVGTAVTFHVTLASGRSRRRAVTCACTSARSRPSPPAAPRPACAPAVRGSERDGSTPGSERGRSSSRCTHFGSSGASTCVSIPSAGRYCASFSGRCTPPPPAGGKYIVTRRTFTGGKGRPVRGLQTLRRPPRESRRSPRRRAPSRRSRPRTATARGRRRARAAPGGTRRNGPCRQRRRSSQLVTGASEKKSPNIEPARRDLQRRRTATRARPSSRSVARSSPSQTPGSASSRSVSMPGRHRQRVAGERPRLVHGAGRGDELHDLAPSAVGAHGQPAADHLAERRQVGRDAVQRLRAARVRRGSRSSPRRR